MSATDLTRGWDAYVERDPLLFCERVVVQRRVGGSIEVVTGWADDGAPVLRVVGEGESLEPGVGWLRLPLGAAMAIAEFMKPGPSSGEVKRLDEALAVERGRVDALLERAFR